MFQHLKKKFPSDFSAKAMSCTEPSNRTCLHSPLSQFVSEGSPAGRRWSVPDTALSAIGGLLSPTRVTAVLHRLAKLISIIF